MQPLSENDERGKQTAEIHYGLSAPPSLGSSSLLAAGAAGFLGACATSSISKSNSAKSSPLTTYTASSPSCCRYEVPAAVLKRSGQQGLPFAEQLDAEGRHGLGGQFLGKIRDFELRQVAQEAVESSTTWRRAP